MRLYKVVDPDGGSIWGGSGQWSLPSDDEPGEWWRLPDDVPLEPCRVGLHLTDAANLHIWLCDGAIVYRAETDSPLSDAGQKYVTRSARLLPGSFPADDIIGGGPEPFRAEDYAKTATDRYALIHRDELPEGHPIRARADRVHAKAERARGRAERKWKRDNASAQRRLAAFFGPDYDAVYALRKLSR